MSDVVKQLQVDSTRVPFTKFVLCGISLHLDYLLQGMRDGNIPATAKEMAVVESLFYRIDGFESAFETPAHALTYQATLEKMIVELGAFYEKLHGA